MKLPHRILPPKGLSPRLLAAFTLPEMIVASAIFLLVLASVISSHIFGLKMFNITSTKLIASREARAALNRVRDDIRSGRTLYVGQGTGAGFINLAANSARQGNAVQIYPGTNTNTFVRYFWDGFDQKLKRAASGTTQIDVIASFVTNQIVFQAEDFLGNALTNDLNNRVVKMTLDFSQWEFAPAQVPGGYFDYYRLQTRMTRRTIE